MHLALFLMDHSEIRSEGVICLRGGGGEREEERTYHMLSEALFFLGTNTMVLIIYVNMLQLPRTISKTLAEGNNCILCAYTRPGMVGFTTSGMKFLFFTCLALLHLQPHPYTVTIILLYCIMLYKLQEHKKLVLFFVGTNLCL